MQADDWRPIDDAAKGMGRVLLWIKVDGGGYSEHGQWDDIPFLRPFKFAWLDDRGDVINPQPTHYQPIVGPHNNGEKP